MKSVLISVQLVCKNTQWVIISPWREARQMEPRMELALWLIESLELKRVRAGLAPSEPWDVWCCPDERKGHSGLDLFSAEMARIYAADSSHF